MGRRSVDPGPIAPNGCDGPWSRSRRLLRSSTGPHAGVPARSGSRPRPEPPDRRFFDSHSSTQSAPWIGAARLEPPY